MDNEVKEFKENYRHYQYLLSVIVKQQRELGFTNKDMAKKLNIHLSSYERIIKGKFMMTVIQLFRICNVLGLDVDVFSVEKNYGIFNAEETDMLKIGDFEFKPNIVHEKIVEELSPATEFISGGPDDPLPF